MDGQEGFYSVFKLCYICLRCVGAWPEQYSLCIMKVIVKIQHFTSIFIPFVFVNIMQTIALILFLDNLEVITTVLSTADLPIVNTTVMMMRFWYKREVVRDLIMIVKNDWIKPNKTDKELEFMNETAVKTKMLSAICIILGNSSCFFYFVTHIYLQYTVQSDTRLLYLLAYIPYDSQKSPNYEITWTCQCMSTFFATAAFIGIETFFVVVVLHVSGQLNVLRYRLQNLNFDHFSFVKNRNSDHLKKEICLIIEKYSELYRIANEIEDIFNFTNVVQLINFTIIFCLLGFRTVTMLFGESGSLMEAVFSVGFFVYLSGNLFVCCYVSEQLRLDSTAIGYATYECCWYTMRKSEVKLLTFVMLRTQKPFEITAGKFFILSLSIFSTLMKTSLSYMSVLIATSKKNA